MRYGVVSLLFVFLAGCASTINTDLPLASGSVHCLTKEARTSILNATVITACTPSRGLVAVNQGTSTGEAALNAANGVMTAGAAGAAIGLVSTGPTQNITVGPPAAH